MSILEFSVFCADVESHAIERRRERELICDAIQTTTTAAAVSKYYTFEERVHINGFCVVSSHFVVFCLPFLSFV